MFVYCWGQFSYSTKGEVTIPRILALVGSCVCEHYRVWVLGLEKMVNLIQYLLLKQGELVSFDSNIATVIDVG